MGVSVLTMYRRASILYPHNAGAAAGHNSTTETISIRPPSRWGPVWLGRISSFRSKRPDLYPEPRSIKAASRCGAHRSGCFAKRSRVENLKFKCWRSTRPILGRFSCRHLGPGTYFIAVAARPWYARSLPQMAAQANPELDVAYPITYYGDTTDPASATPVNLAEGGSPAYKSICGRYRRYT